MGNKTETIRFRWKIVLLLGLLLAVAFLFCRTVGVAAQEMETESGATRDADTTIADGVYIGRVAVGGMTQAEAAAAVDAYIDSLKDAKFTLVGAAGSITVTADDMGVTADTDTCVTQAARAATSGNLIERFKEKKALDSGTYVVDLPVGVDKQQTAELIYDAKSSLDIAAEDNTLVRENGAFVFVEGQSGKEVDVVASVYAINTYLADEWNGGDAQIDLVMEEVAARGSQEEFSHIKDVIGTCTTDFSSSSASRATNVSNGCEKVNGSIIYPGEEFSVYEAVSPFTEENGYALAGSYSNGTTVESFGGGICQVSTTLYNAVLRAELQVTMRCSHSMIVTYVQPSMDAAISGTYKDLRFINNTDYPIYIQGYCSGGTITFNIYGEETRDPNRVVTFESEVTDTTEPEVQINLDSSAKIGSYHTEQTSHTGYVARLWKVVTVNGVEESRKVINNSTYSASPTIVVFGTKGATEEQLAALKAAQSAKDLNAAKAVANAITEEPADSEEPDDGDENLDDGSGTDTNDGTDDSKKSDGNTDQNVDTGAAGDTVTTDDTDSGTQGNTGSDAGTGGGTDGAADSAGGEAAD